MHIFGLWHAKYLMMPKMTRPRLALSSIPCLHPRLEKVGHGKPATKTSQGLQSSGSRFMASLEKSSMSTDRPQDSWTQCNKVLLSSSSSLPPAMLIKEPKPNNIKAMISVPRPAQSLNTRMWFPRGLLGGGWFLCFLTKSLSFSTCRSKKSAASRPCLFLRSDTIASLLLERLYS